MSTAAPLQNLAAKPKPLSNSTHAGLLLQRKCACGSPTSSLTGQCAQCKTQKRLQTKLTIGASNDPLEQEADRVADQVMATSAHSAVSGAPPRIQRFSGQATGQADTAPASVDRALASPGSPLAPALQQDMEQRFGHDFSRVRVHSGAAAEQSAREVNANAYAAGHNIVFGAGRFAPGTHEGRRLLAHELAHVVQQRQSASLKIRMSRLRDFNDKDEMHDPSKLTDTQIEATNEFKIYMDSALGWQWRDKVTREEALLACRLILRHMREGHAVVWSSEGRVFMNLARGQQGTLKKAVGEVGKLEWVPFRTGTAVSDPSKLDSDFGKWILAGGTEPDAGTGKVNCWEMVLFSAYKGGFTSKARIDAVYNEAVKQVKAGTRSFVGDTIEVELRRGKEYVLDLANPKSPEPLPGDIVIFTNAKNHVAISSGTKDGSGRHKIISHWPPPDGIYKTKETTIEQLLPAMIAGTTIKFWSPKW